jgi:hypothetical protein
VGSLAILVLLAVVVGLPITLVVFCVRLFQKWPGYLRGLAILPLAPLPIWTAQFVFDIRRDPTSHNLFPFEIGGVVAVSFVILMIVAVIYDVTVRRR